MPLSATPIDAKPLATAVMRRCDRLAEHSEEPGRITRRFLTPAAQEVHRVVLGWMHEAGLKTHVDAAGNLYGRNVGATSPALLVGSHLDTVPGAGRYDGILGVLIGIALAEAFQDQELPFPLEVVGFSEEEGIRFNKPYLGSSAVAGCFDPAWLERVDETGIPLARALVNFGCDPAELPRAALSAESVLAFVEPHIEQGTALETTGAAVGVVTAIAGQSRVRLALHGEARHAGATPLAARRDALVPAAALVGEVRRLALATEGLHATVGKLDVEPNAPNVIAARVEVALDVRHADDVARESAVASLLAAAERFAEQERCGFEVLEATHQAAVAMTLRWTERLAESAHATGHGGATLTSWAGHDAAVMARRFPAAMLFVRHPGGVSHHPDERVEEADVAAAIEVLIDFTRRMAADYPSCPLTDPLG